MTTLEFYTIKTMINFNYLKVNSSRCEMERKGEKWKSVIESMKQTESDLLRIYESWDEATDLIRKLSRDNYHMSAKIDQLERQNKKLKKQNKELIENVNL